MLYTVQFAVWETRTKDFEEFAEYAQKHESELDSNYAREETKPSYKKHRSNVFEREETTADHPVVCISRQTTQAFCEWLTMVDHAKGLIPADYAYRLPSDLEWSSAALVKEDRNPDLSPFKRETTAILPDICKSGAYPEYPLGNLKGSEYDRHNVPHTGILKVDDGYVKTCPVGRFAPNPLGIFDLLGNVYEKCLDFKYDDDEAYERWMLDSQVDRGPSYDRFIPNLATRYGWMGQEVGFRIVLAQKGILPYGYHGERPTMPYSKRLERKAAAPEAKPDRKETPMPQSRPHDLRI
jgi:formylglycine-generating enzyme required for sulfatase activity